MNLIKKTAFILTAIIFSVNSGCCAMNSGEIAEISDYFKVYRAQKTTSCKSKSIHIIVKNFSGNVIQVIADSNIIEKLIKELKENVRYQNPIYFSLISGMVNDCSVMDSSHHFYINKSPTSENMKNAIFIIKNTLKKLGYAKVHFHINR